MNSNSLTVAPDYRISGDCRIAYRSTLKSSADNQALDDDTPHVLFCGGFHSNMCGTKAVALEGMCAELNLSYTRFDYKGHGESEGKPESYNLNDWLEDLLCIMDSLEGSVLLIGSSMGAWLATTAALRRHQKVKALLLLAAAPDFLQELVVPRLSKSDLWDLQQGQTINLENAYDSPYPISQSLIDSGKDLSLFTPSPFPPGLSPEELDIPIAFIHGTADSDVPYELSIRLMSKFIQSDGQLTLLNGADHRLSDQRSLNSIKQALVMLKDQCTV